ncbi:peptidyl-prolyl cis-trans isomerase [Ralstonia mannitolilytica]|uniref:peptidylprolyl isomerase n=1 Tax=Ralstonia mannitolilytica TaxID=105219 RepID=UPI000CEEE3A1|nr:peptidylprolyl isomerase [Ralstonia mannitolilytica]MBU9578895.1 peptidyl-prolyl cis-trans isomerase [Ralstonia mannitolilytica]
MLRIRSLFAGLVCALAVSAAAAAAPAPRVQFKTSMGNFTVEVYPDKAPKTVSNFLQYVKDGFYKGTIFHRVMDGFMIQGGGFTPDMKQKDTRPPVEIESKNGLKNDKYTIAMARTMDPNSATAQFYVNVVDNNMLNYPGQDGYGYTVFGKVVEGTDTIDKIKAVETTTRFPHQNVPVKPIVIESATVVSK